MLCISTWGEPSLLHVLEASNWYQPHGPVLPLTYSVSSARFPPLCVPSHGSQVLCQPFSSKLPQSIGACYLIEQRWELSLFLFQPASDTWKEETSSYQHFSRHSSLY